MARERGTTRKRGAAGTVPTLQARPELEGLAGTLDEVRATILTMVAILAEKEAVLRARREESALPGVEAGLADIAALQRWAQKTLRTVDVLSRGQAGELRTLLEELGEFEQIVGEA